MCVFCFTDVCTNTCPASFKLIRQGIMSFDVMVALNKIEADLLGKPHKNKIPGYSLMPTSIYSISKIIENVNPVDKNFLKYIPDRFLSPNQRDTKTSASEDDVDIISGLFEKQGGKREDLWGDTNALYERLTQLVRGEEVATDGDGREADFDILICVLSTFVLLLCGYCARWCRDCSEAARQWGCRRGG